MSRKPNVTRRTFLRGGGAFVALPFLEIMYPRLAMAQAAPVKRFITAFHGSVVSNMSVPAAVGALPASLPAAWASLNAVKQYISIVSNMSVPVYAPSVGWVSPATGTTTKILGKPGATMPVIDPVTQLPVIDPLTGQAKQIPLATTAVSMVGGNPEVDPATGYTYYFVPEPFIPGGSHSGTHGFTRGPILSGMGSYESMQIPQACKTASQPGSQTSDQYAADAFGALTKFRSLQLKVQAVPYNGNQTSSNGSISARSQGGLVSNLEPVVSPVDIYNMLFGSGNPTSPQPSTLLLRKKSVLDLVLEDANRLIGSLGGDDKARMQLHFDGIRDMENGIAAQIAGGSTGGTCSGPTAPPADTPPDSLQFGGWANETQRGQIQADLIAYAIACDLTRVVSWVLTHDQCWINSFQTGASTTLQNAIVPDMHQDSHFAPDATRAANCNWSAALFSRLVQNLVTRTDANGPLINNTFMSMVSAEGRSFHSRSGLVQVVAGNPGKINLGQHIDAGGAHPARLQISGLQSIGVNMNDKMGQVTGTIAALLK